MATKEKPVEKRDDANEDAGTEMAVTPPAKGLDTYDADYDEDPIVVPSDPCMGDVRVLVRTKCGDQVQQPLGATDVRLTGRLESGEPYDESATTDPSGFAYFKDVPIGDYQIDVSKPGYRPAQQVAYKIGGKDQSGKKAVTVVSSDLTTLEYQVPLEGVDVTGFAYLAGPDGSKLRPIKGLPVDILQQGKRLACVKTDDKGEFKAEKICPGMTAIQAAKTLSVGCQNMFLAQKAPLLLIEPGCTPPPVALAYKPMPAELKLCARKREMRDGKEHLALLENTSFDIYEGARDTGTLLRTVTMKGHEEIQVTGLRSGTLDVVARPEDPNLRPVNGCSIVASIFLNDGQIADLCDSFIFESCQNTVIGRVVDSCGQPIPNVPMHLSPHGGHHPALVENTDSQGEARFTVNPGHFTLSVPRTFRYGLTDYVPVGDTTERHIMVGASAHTQGYEVKMQPDENRITGKFVSPDGAPSAYLPVTIRNSRHEVVCRLSTSKDGELDALVAEKGDYTVEVAGLRIPVTVASTAKIPPTTVGGPGGGAFAGRGLPPGTAGQVAESVIDLSAYPVLTEEVGYPPSPLSIPAGGPGSVGSGSGGGASLGVIASNTLRDVLGWRVRTDDPKGFIGALTQSFELTDVEGHVESKWTPRTYAVQTDLSGGITGAQASIYTRAEEAIDAAQPLLEGLYALRDDADDQDVSALKAIVKSQMNELVRELGIPGGPRLVRVDQIFTLLIGPQTTPLVTEPDNVTGQLGTLRDEMGLWSVNPRSPNPEVLINTVEEEQNVTNYRILVDYITSLRQNWINSRQFFGRTTQTPFFGTQLVLLSRQFSVVAESVNEVRFAMDSVFIGPSERQTIELAFPNGVRLPGRGVFPRPGDIPPNTADPAFINDSTIDSDPLLVEELLSWVQNFAAEEGPRLVQDGGKFGVSSSVLPIVCKIRNLVFGAQRPTNLPDLPRGYRTLRVQRAWQELATQLDELAFLSFPVKHTIPSQV